MAKGDISRSTCMSLRDCCSENELSLSPDFEDTAMLSESFTSLLYHNSGIFVGKENNV